MEFTNSYSDGGDIMVSLLIMHVTMTMGFPTYDSAISMTTSGPATIRRGHNISAQFLNLNIHDVSCSRLFLSGKIPTPEEN